MATDDIRYTHLKAIMAKAEELGSESPVGPMNWIGFGPMQDDISVKTPSLELFFNNVPGQEPWPDRRVDFDGGFGHVTGDMAAGQWLYRFSARLTYFSRQEKEQSMAKLASLPNWLMRVVYESSLPDPANGVTPNMITVRQAWLEPAGGPPRDYILKAYIRWELSVVQM